MNNKNSNKDLLTVDFLIEIGRNYYKFILKRTLLFLLLGALVFLTSEKKYLSTAKIFPSSSDASSSILSQAQSFGFNLGSDLGSEGIYSSDIYESILNSRRLAQATIKDEFSLNEFQENKVPLYKILFGENNDEISEQEIISIVTDTFINNHLSVYKAPGKSIITISIITNNPFLSKSILDSLLINMNEIYREHKLSSNLLKLEFIQERILSNSKELLSLEEKYEKFLLENKNYTNSVSLLIREDRIQRELDILKSLSISLKTQYEGIRLETIDKSTAIEILDYPEVSFDYYSPSLLLNLLIGLIIGLVYSLIMIYFRIVFELRNNT